MKQVGQRVGVTSQQMAKIECGHNRVSAAMLMDIAEVLETPVSTLLQGENESAPIALGALELGKLYDDLQPQERKHLLGIARALAGKHGVNENA